MGEASTGESSRGGGTGAGIDFVGASSGYLGAMANAMLALDSFPTNSVPDGIPDIPIVLLGSLGSKRSMWREQIEALNTIGPVYAIDIRGHGDSQVLDEPTTMADLAQDVIRSLNMNEIASVHVVGLSIGGAIAQELALSSPERVERLVLSSTAPKFGEADAWRQRIDIARNSGLGSLVGPVMSKWFTPDWADTHPDVISNIHRNFVETDPVGYARCCEALAGFDTRNRLGEISAPTLVVSATEDGSTPPEVVGQLADGIDGATRVSIEGAAHMCNLQCPDEYNAALVDFLKP